MAVAPQRGEHEQCGRGDEQAEGAEGEPATPAAAAASLGAPCHALARERRAPTLGAEPVGHRAREEAEHERGARKDLRRSARVRECAGTRLVATRYASCGTMSAAAITGTMTSQLRSRLRSTIAMIVHVSPEKRPVRGVR
jgi:hypothetical protein